MFWLMGQNHLSNLLSKMALWALKVKLPMDWLVKATVYKQFCGGENEVEYAGVLANMQRQHLFAILDYSVEGKESEADFEHTYQVLLSLVGQAKKYPNIPCICLKMTGLVSFSLLEKKSNGVLLSEEEKKQWELLLVRLDRLCEQCRQADLPLYIDAEESWIQPAIDRVVETLMSRYNKQKALVYQTIQMYRWDRLQYLKDLYEQAIQQSYYLGIKIVRGAYLEKERLRAFEQGYKSPIQPNKESTDLDYHQAILFCFERLAHVEICLGTHNEESCLYMTQLMELSNKPKNTPGIWFSQLYGMSDHISYNLAAQGYHVSKYLPFGPVKHTMPYLIRRAQENSSIAGQMGKEYGLYVKELQRRKNKSAS